MGFINEGISGVEDFVTKLDAFLTTDGWTPDELDVINGNWAISRGTVFIQARWEVPEVANPSMGLYQSTAFVAVTLPGLHTNDSGNGIISPNNSSLITGRNIFLGTNVSQYWAFTANANPRYVHVVIQVDDGRFTHFGFGEIDKIGDWTGGEYCYGYRQQTGFNNSVAILGGTSVLLDGLSVDSAFPQPDNMEDFVATMRIESFPNQTGPRWGVCMGNQNGSNLGTDRDAGARQRLIGGFRGSMLARSFGRYLAARTDGLVPMYPIMIWYEDTTQVTISATVVIPLGWMQDVRGVSIANFIGGDIVPIGGDDWYLFPTSIKGESGTTSLSGTSAHQGIAYRKI